MYMTVRNWQSEIGFPYGCRTPFLPPRSPRDWKGQGVKNKKWEGKSWNCQQKKSEGKSWNCQQKEKKTKILTDNIWIGSNQLIFWSNLIFWCCLPWDKIRPVRWDELRYSTFDILRPSYVRVVFNLRLL